MSIHPVAADLFVIDGGAAAVPPVVAYRVEDRLYVLGRAGTAGQQAAMSAIKASYPTPTRLRQIEPDAGALGAGPGVVWDGGLRVGGVLWGGWQVDGGEVLVLDPPGTGDPMIMLIPAHGLVLDGESRRGDVLGGAPAPRQRLLALIDTGALELLCTAETAAPLDTEAARDLLERSAQVRAAVPATTGRRRGLRSGDVGRTERHPSWSSDWPDAGRG